MKCYYTSTNMAETEDINWKSHILLIEMHSGSATLGIVWQLTENLNTQWSSPANYLHKSYANMLRQRPECECL